MRGVVQGVGFRPFVYQIAAEHRLKGWVRNTSGEVEIEVEGEDAALARFLSDLETKAPPMARIEAISHDYLPPEGYSSFRIRESQAYQEKYQLVSPDIATCDACRQEVFSPSDRRFRYPFTNCTNCGPRFTIIEDIPYDRPRTTMRQFKMCPDCRREYDDPLDRRFHAQPNACPICGPRLELVDGRGHAVTSSRDSEVLTQESGGKTGDGVGEGVHECIAVSKTTPVLHGHPPLQDVIEQTCTLLRKARSWR